MLKRIYSAILAIVLAAGVAFSGNVFSSIAAEDNSQTEEAVEADTEENIENTEEIEPQQEQNDSDAIEVAKNGVVQVNCVYKNKDGENFIYKGSTGILIGSSDKDEYVLTSLARMNPEEEAKNEFLAAVGVGADERNNVKLEYEVVVENDITAAASLVSSSADLDLAVFKLSQILYNRTPMTFIYSSEGDISGYNTVDSAYALGFPNAVEFDSEVKYYSNDRVNKTAGQLSNVITQGETQFLEHKAEIGDSNVGGPLVTADGLVLGMNSSKIDGNYYYALSSNSIIKVLNGLGIVYDGVTFEDKEAEAKALEEEEKKKAQEQQKEDKVIEVHTETPKWVIPLIIGLALLLLIAIIVVIILLVKTIQSNKKASNMPIPPYHAQPTAPPSFGGEISSDTTVLGAAAMPNAPVIDGGMTTLSGQLNGGTLIRKKTGENIAITKNDFCIGKDDLRCDYCIKDNNTISRQHVIIRISGNAAYIEDSNSKNGSFLNGYMLIPGQPQELRDGDVIKLANDEFVYKK